MKRTYSVLEEMAENIVDRCVEMKVPIAISFPVFNEQGKVTKYYTRLVTALELDVPISPEEDRISPQILLLTELGKNFDIVPRRQVEICDEDAHMFSNCSDDE